MSTSNSSLDIYTTNIQWTYWRRSSYSAIMHSISSSSNTNHLLIQYFDEGLMWASGGALVDKTLKVAQIQCYRVIEWWSLWDDENLGFKYSDLAKKYHVSSIGNKAKYSQLGETNGVSSFKCRKIGSINEWKNVLPNIESKREC